MRVFLPFFVYVSSRPESPMPIYRDHRRSLKSSSDSRDVFGGKHAVRRCRSLRTEGRDPGESSRVRCRHYSCITFEVLRVRARIPQAPAKREFTQPIPVAQPRAPARRRTVSTAHGLKLIDDQVSDVPCLAAFASDAATQSAHNTGCSISFCACW